MSLRGDKYETLEEVQTRLNHSVVTYDGEPVYIREVRMPEGMAEKGEIARVYFDKLPMSKNEAKTERKFLSSKKFDLTPVKLGFLNYGGGAFYLSRIPQRQYNQGLTGRTFRAVDCTTKGELRLPTFADLVYKKEFLDCLTGKYPTVDEASERLREVRGVAITREFAMTKDDDLDIHVLKHKDSSCGIRLDGRGGFRLSAKFKFLRESLEEARIPIA